MSLTIPFCRSSKTCRMFFCTIVSKRGRMTEVGEGGRKGRKRQLTRQCKSWNARTMYTPCVSSNGKRKTVGGTPYDAAVSSSIMISSALVSRLSQAASRIWASGLWKSVVLCQVTGVLYVSLAIQDIIRYQCGTKRVFCKCEQHTKL